MHCACQRCGSPWPAPRACAPRTPHPSLRSTFALNRERAVDFLNQLGKLYVCDGYACWDAGARVRVRVVCARPSHALQAHNMLIR